MYVFYYYYNNHFTALWTTQLSRYQKDKPIWILLKQETVSGSGISWAICKSAPCPRQITTPAPYHSVFLQAGCPSCLPTNSVKALKALKYTWMYSFYITTSQDLYIFTCVKLWMLVVIVMHQNLIIKKIDFLKSRINQSINQSYL